MAAYRPTVIVGNVVTTLLLQEVQLAWSVPCSPSLMRQKPSLLTSLHQDTFAGLCLISGHETTSVSWGTTLSRA